MKRILYSFLIVFLCSSPLMALETVSPQQLFDFASSLHSSRDYYGAVIEFKRLVSYFPSGPLTEEASFMIGKSYYDAGRMEDAAKTFESFVGVFPDSKNIEAALAFMAKADYASGYYKRGIKRLLDVKVGLKDQSMMRASDYLIGWGYLGDHDFDRSNSVFHYVSTSESEYREFARSLAYDVKKGKDLPSKSPLLAGLFSSILPGSGQMYAGRYYDGLVSFFFNALFIYLAADNFRIDNDPTAILFTAIELGWYTGNIYSAVGSAHKYNEVQKDEFVGGLKIKYGFEF